MAEGLRTTDTVWDEAYWAGVEAESSGVNAKIAERLSAADRATLPSVSMTPHYSYRSSDGELDEVGRLRPVARASTREASIGVDDLVEPGEIVSVRVIGTVSLAPEFSDPDGLPNYYD